MGMWNKEKSIEGKGKKPKETRKIVGQKGKKIWIKNNFKKKKFYVGQ
jgi:hypothetical protein